MNPGSAIVTLAWGSFVAIVIYGASCDLRRWWRSDRGWPERLRWRRDQKRCVMEMRARDLAELQRDSLEAKREAQQFAWIAEQIQEIRGLPEVVR